MKNTKQKVLKPLTDGLLREYATLANKEIMEQATQSSKWLIDNFLMRGTLNMFYASAGVGKSLFSLELANFLAKQKDVAKVIYLDGDNSKSSLALRGLNEITQSHGIKLEYYFATSEKKRFGMLSKFKDYNLHNVVIIIDSIRNFIRFDMKDDVKVTRFLQRLQELRDSGGTIIFLHHQPKQYGEENNKMYKGATAFVDSVDEAWYIAKSFKQNADSKILSLDLEPQKHRLDTKPQRVDINNKAHNIFFRQDMLMGLNQKQYITLELAQEIINANPQGIIQSELAKQIVKLANANYYEIVGKNSLWNLLDEFKDKLFCVETFTPRGGGIRKLYKPLKAAAKTTNTKNPKTPSTKEVKTTNTLSILQRIIADSKEGIVQKDLVDLLRKQAADRTLEIVGKNTLWKLLDKYNGVFYKAEKTQRKNGYGITKMYLPLRDCGADSTPAMRVG